MSPPPANPQPRPARYQFRLSWLIYLLTVVALGLTVLRHVFGMGWGREFNLVMAVYVGLLTAYFAFRFPILWRRLSAAHEVHRRQRSRRGPTQRS